MAMSPKIPETEIKSTSPTDRITHCKKINKIVTGHRNSNVTDWTYSTRSHCMEQHTSIATEQQYDVIHEPTCS
jgi:hypothetical protein